MTDWVAVAPFDELVGSWDVVADVEAEREVEIAVQARRAGQETRWYVLVRRSRAGWSSVPGEADGDASVDVDILRSTVPFEAFRLRVDGGVARMLAACTTGHGFGGPGGETVRVGHAVEIPIRPLSQMVYAGHYPELDGGGGSWCSPTSLAMVMARWGVTVEVADLARAVYDPAYGGCGNWSLNVAVAAGHGLDAVVTRLPTLAAARPLLDASVPLVMSIAMPPGALPGFPLDTGTTGHLVVLAGETADGDPIVLDPAAPTAGGVRRIYPRGPFESAWLEGSRGTTYVVRPPAHPVPPSDRW